MPMLFSDIYVFSFFFFFMSHTRWCWFEKSYQAAKLGGLYIYVTLVMSYTIYVFCSIYWKLWRFKGSSKVSLSRVHRAARLRVARKVMFYLLGFIITWIWSLLNRMTQAITGNSYPFLVLMHIITKPLRGLWDSLAYSSALSFLCACRSDSKGRGSQYMRGA